MHRCVLALAVSAAHAFVATTHKPCSIALRSSLLSDDVFPSTATDVFVGNMPYGMSDDYVKDLVYTVRKDDGSPVNPEVLRVTVPRDEETGKDRGLAFIKVLDATQAADLSEALDGFEYRAVWKSTCIRVHRYSSLSHFFSATMWPRWLRRVVRNRHRHAIEQASRRWRGDRRGDSGRTRRKFDFRTGEDSNRTTAIILLKTPYAIGFVVALFLHLLLPEDKEEEEEEDSGKEMKVDPVEA